MEFYTETHPMRLLQELESDGVKLSVRKGKLFGSKNMTPVQTSVVKANKSALLAVITHQCPTCNQPLRTFDCPTYRALQCPTDALHFYEELMKPGAKYKFVLTGGVRPTTCQECGAHNDGEYKYCDACWRKFIEAA